ncbi:MAG: hypothetical protein ACRD2C_21220 [Acidimicrobiales bacterium]
MGKASSSKKIARAARAGGRVTGVRQRNLLFPGAIGAIILLGTALVVIARSDHQDDASTVPPLAGVDHWHAAYGFYICDEFLGTTPAGTTSSPAGIHTHGDSVVHIHPGGQAGAGENATLGTFLEDIPDVELTDDALTIGDDTWENGETQCGDETGELVVARWQDVQTTDEEPSLTYSGFDDLRFRNNGEGYTIAFVPEGETDVPKPPSASNLAELGAIDTEDPEGAGSTTLPADASSTTVPADGTATTAPPADGATTTAPPADATTTTAAP